MPRPRSAVPSYLRHKSSGLGYARFGGSNGPTTYFPGPYGSAASKAAYAAALTAFQANGNRVPTPAGELTVGKLVGERFAHVKARHVKPDGKTPTSEVSNQRNALKRLAEQLGDRLAASVRPADFQGLADKLVAADYSLQTVRHFLARARACFRWAAVRDLVPPDVYARLAAWRPEKLKARRPPKKKPVPPADVDAVVRIAPAWMGAAIRVQYYGGMRPGDVCALRPCDLDRAADPWVYTVRPDVAKTAGPSGDGLHYFLGPNARAALGPLLERRGLKPTDPVFATRTGRPVPPGYYGCRCRLLSARAGVPVWSPHALRHGRATDLRSRLGIETAQAVLQHTRPEMTSRYSSRLDELARAAARESG